MDGCALHLTFQFWVKFLTSFSILNSKLTQLRAMDMMVQIANITSSHCFLTRHSIIDILVGVPFCQFDPEDPDNSQDEFLSK